MSANVEFGFQLPGYVLLREIGRGGVSTVYLARHELLDRQVAIKVMSPALAVEEGFNKRFIREGQTVAQLKHPGIVTVYDVAVVDYRPYIAMEYLPGGSLKERIGAPLPPAEAIDYLRTITESLGYAHSRGVFHRDVKPENILFRDTGEIVLTDFGIAKSEAQETALTSIGVVVGTPRYISPELAQGHDSDARSDIYALGVIFHEMLTGKPPYDVKGSMSLLYAHINEPIPRLPAPLAAYQGLLDDLLAKVPEARIADCAALARRLESPRQKPRRRPWRAVHPRGKARPGRGLIWSLAGLVVLPLVVLALWIQGYLPGGPWGPDTGREFRTTVAALVAAGDSSGEPEQSEAPAASRGPDGSRTASGRALTPAPAARQAQADGGTPPVPDSAADDTPDVLPSAAAPVPDPPQLDAESIYKQGQALLSGEVSEQNLVVAAALHQQAARRGYADAQYYLGVAYGNGAGVERDESRAVHWLERAADAGVRGAQYNLVLAQLFGRHADPAAAAAMAEALAAEGYTPAYRILGWMYNTGTGVESSFVQSVRWNAKTMVGDLTGRAGPPRWVVHAWERALQAELDRIHEPAPQQGVGAVK